MSEKYTEEDASQQADHTADADVLHGLGYKQEFKRELSLWSTFSVAFSVIGLVPSIATVMYVAFGYAGSVGAVWGWITCAILIQALGFSMAEICSSLPTAGGLYYAASVLAPEGWGPLAAWIVGWSNLVGQVLTGPSIDWALASFIVSIATLYNPDYVNHNWHTYLIYLAILFTQVIITSAPTKALGHINGFGAFLNTALVFIFIIVIPSASKIRPKFLSSDYVWTNFVNGTEWPDGFAFLQTFLAVIYTLAGFDAPFHLSEESSNANVAAPRAIVLTTTLGGILGFAVVLVIAYTLGDVSVILGSEVGQPMATYCQTVLGHDGGLAVLVLLIFATYAVGVSCLTASPRVVFAYSRDNVIPFSAFFRHVNRTTRTPVRCTVLVGVIGALVGLLSFGGAVAIGAIFSIVAVAQYCAFALPVAIKLFSGGSRFKPGPWNLGIASRPINAVAVAFVALIIPILCFPTVNGADLTPQTMNWASLLYGGTMFLALVWYAIDARKWFKGPRANIHEA